MTVRILVGDALARLAELPDASVQTCVTSPPYFGLRSYLGANDPDKAKEIGLEPTPAEYVARLVEVFREVRRVLRPSGTVWLNLGDSYNNRSVARKSSHQGGLGFESADLSKSWAELTKEGRTRLSFTQDGLKEKDLIGIPWRVAFALQDDGWYLRSDIIWAKPNPMPESVTDRPTKAHEYIFLLSKSPRYHYDAAAIAEPSSGVSGGPWSQATHAARRAVMSGGEMVGRPEDTGFRHARSVWTIATAPFAEAHFATFPPEIPRRCILAGTSERGQCPTCGAPWARVTESHRNGRDWNANNRAGGSRLAVGQSASDAMPTDYRPPTTIGWQPSCRCNAGDPVPQTVMDPFAGAGTTGLVADRLGRNFVGIELNPAYAEMAMNRIRNDAPMFADVELSA